IEIEKHLQKPSNFKWIYNELEASTAYVPFFNGNSEEISSIDEQQRKLLEESFNCRKSQISQLIRSITRFLRAESYRRVERHLRSEISRIEKSTSILRNRYEEEERTLENEARESISSRVARVRKEQDQINSEQGGEITKYRNLEERYLRKKSQLEWEQSEVEQEQVNYDAAIEEERDYIKEHLTEREVRKDIDRQEKELDKEFRELEERERE
ncbi:hypothetical protein FNJ87_20570, partial [Nonlabens mediterrranea]|nr:hypothetical protein [Nonlabens mediterrranea]